MVAMVICSVMLLACDPQRISELEEGVSTEADVRTRFGEPEKIWDGAGGSRVFEYNRQPEGVRNYMITIGPDEQVGTVVRSCAGKFLRIVPGMMIEEVRRALGKPARITRYDRQREIHYNWRYLEPPNTTMAFTVVFSPDYRVLRTMQALEPDEKGGPR